MAPNARGFSHQNRRAARGAMRQKRTPQLYENTDVHTGTTVTTSSVAAIQKVTEEEMGGKNEKTEFPQ